MLSLRDLAITSHLRPGISGGLFLSVSPSKLSMRVLVKAMHLEIEVMFLYKKKMNV